MFPLLKSLVRIFCKAIFFVKVENIENIPKEGAVILAANHISLWDAPVLVSSIPRYMRAMAKKELFENRILAAILKLSGAFPVSRGTGDITAIKTALKTLKDGHIFTIFPSGRRVKKDEEAGAKAGVALIAARSGAPVIPIALCGGYRLFHRVTIKVGEPMYIKPADGKKPSGEELKSFADAVMEKIELLGA